jgi:hypothetical protein
MPNFIIPIVINKHEHLRFVCFPGEHLIGDNTVGALCLTAARLSMLLKVEGSGRVLLLDG